MRYSWVVEIKTLLVIWLRENIMWEFKQQYYFLSKNKNYCLSFLDYRLTRKFFREYCKSIIYLILLIGIFTHGRASFRLWSKHWSLLHSVPYITFLGNAVWNTKSKKRTMYIYQIVLCFFGFLYYTLYV